MVQQWRFTHCAVFSASPMPVNSLSASASSSSLLAMVAGLLQAGGFDGLIAMWVRARSGQSSVGMKNMHGV